MIPIALDYSKVVDEESPESEFLVPLLRQREQTQCLWIFAPNGDSLGGFESSVPVHKFEQEIASGRSIGMASNVLRQIDSALKGFASTENPRVFDSLTSTYRGVGVRKNGAVDFAVYVRRRDNSNIQTPVLSTFSLSETELKAFDPSGLIQGQKKKLPNSIARKFCRMLSPMGSEEAPQPDWITETEISFQWKADANGLSRLKFTGRMASAQEGFMIGSVRSEQQLDITGSGTFNKQTGQLLSLQLLGAGEICWPSEAPDQSISFDSLAEWQVE